MDTNRTAATASETEDTSTDVRTTSARKPTIGKPIYEETEKHTGTTGHTDINKGLNCLKRSEALIERINSLTQHVGFRHRRRSPTSGRLATATSRAEPSAPTTLSSIGARGIVEQQRAPCRVFGGQQAGDRVARQDLGGHKTAPLRMLEDASVWVPSPASSTMPTSAIAGSVFPLSPLEQVTDNQLSRYARLIYDKTGIRVSPQKKMLLSNRLRRRLRKTGIDSFDAYYRHLQSLCADNPEWDAFFQEITTHETYLFRDESQWDWFSRVYLEQHVSTLRASRRPRRLRIWSAACSTGDEVYTIACCVAASLPNLQVWEVDILGTDIAAAELRRAEQAVYGQRAMRLVPRECLRFFVKAENTESWSAKPILQQMVRFRQHNLMQRLKEPSFDIVFLKNVLIYFDKDSKCRALQNVRPLIRPGGLLVAGAAEGVAGLLGDFKRLEPWLYQRPNG